MVYLEQFAVPDLTREDDYMYKCGNGCGKTTLLNVITQKLGLSRSGRFNRTPHFEDYLRMGSYRLEGEDRGFPVRLSAESCFISGDDVFAQIMRRREVNEDIEARRARASGRCSEARRSMRLNTYEQGGVEPFSGTHGSAPQFLFKQDIVNSICHVLLLA